MIRLEFAYIHFLVYINKIKPQQVKCLKLLCEIYAFVLAVDLLQQIAVGGHNTCRQKGEHRYGGCFMLLFRCVCVYVYDCLLFPFNY